MKTPAPLVRSALTLGILLAAGCSTPDGRIAERRALFDSLPAETQTKIRAGEVEVGYTPDMVSLALGKPDRTFMRTTNAGTSEVWAYRSKRPSFSVGFGVGGGGGSTSVGAGVGMSTDGNRDDDRLRVVFEGGRVASVERRGK